MAETHLVKKLTQECEDLTALYHTEVEARLNAQLEVERLKGQLEDSGWRRRADAAQFDTDLRLARFEAEQSRQECLFWKAKHAELMSHLRQISLAPQQQDPVQVVEDLKKNSTLQSEEDLQTDLDFSELYLEEKSKVFKLVHTVDDLLSQVEALNSMWRERQFSQKAPDQPPQCIYCEQLSLEKAVLEHTNAALTEDIRKILEARARLVYTDLKGQSHWSELVKTTALDLAEREKTIETYRAFAVNSSQKVEEYCAVIARAKDQYDGLLKELMLCKDRLKVVEERPGSTKQLEDDVLRSLIGQQEQQVRMQEDALIQRNSKIRELQAELSQEREAHLVTQRLKQDLGSEAAKLKEHCCQLNLKLDECTVAAKSARQFAGERDAQWTQMNAKTNELKLKAQSQQVHVEQLQKALADKEVEIGELRVKAKETEILMCSKLENAKLPYLSESELAVEEFQERLNQAKLREVESSQLLAALGNEAQELGKLNAALSSQVSAYNAQVEAANNECDRLRAEVEKAWTQSRAKSDEVTAVQTALSQVQSELLNAKSEAGLLKSMTAVLTPQVEALRKELTMKEAEVKQQLLKQTSLRRLAAVAARVQRMLKPNP
jgi:chromosome segregation ATPase